MSSCVTPEQFRRLLAEDLSPPERQTVEAHVDACPHCQEALARLLDGTADDIGLDWRLLQGARPGPAPDGAEDFLRRLQKHTMMWPAADGGDGHAPSAIQFPDPPTAQGPLGRLESYHVVAELGKGSFGFVYKAYDEQLDCLVALKVLKPAKAANPEDRARFEREARATAAVRHDHVVIIHRVGSSPGFPLPYLVMEYLDGEPLGERLKRDGALPPREAAEVVRQVALGLAAAHARGLVHRDISLTNIMLDRGSGRAKITDFGLARRVEVGPTNVTLSVAIAGTPPYMSPEHINAPDRVDARSDVYGLGVVLYQLLTGELPFRGTLQMLLQQVVHDEPRPPRKLNDSVPRDLETITLKCLAKEPGRRYQTADELADDLRRWQNGEPVRARPVGRAERLWRWCRRKPVVATLSAAVILLLLGTTAASLAAAVVFAGLKSDAEVARDQAQDAEERARQNAVRVQQQTDLAIQTVYQVVNQIQGELKGVAGAQPVQLKMLQLADAKLDELERDAERQARQFDEPLFDRTRAGIFQRRADIYLNMNQTAKAVELFQRGHDILARLAREAPNEWVHQRNLALLCQRLGKVKEQIGDYPAARSYQQQALAARLRWAELTPTSRDALLGVANAYHQLGLLSLGTGDAVAARDEYRQSAAWQDKVSPDDQRQPDVLRERAGLYGRLGDVSVKLDDAEGARQYYQKALDIRQSLAAAETAPRFAERQNLSISFVQLGDVGLLMLNDPAAARRSYAEALKLREQAAEADPNSSYAQEQLAEACYRLGTTCLRLGETAEAEKYFRECLARRRALAEKEPRSVRFKLNMVVALARCGRHQEAADEADRLRLRLAKSPVLYQVACMYALCGVAQDPVLAERCRAAAISTLRQARAAGWKDLFDLQKDPDLDPIRGHPEFPTLVADVKQARERGRPPEAGK